MTNRIGWRAVVLVASTAMSLGAGCGVDATESPDSSGQDLGTATQGLTEVWRQEAENEPYSSSYPRAVGTGSGASGNAYLALNWTGGPYFSWYAPSDGYYRLAPHLGGTYCGDWPQAALWIDAYSVGYRTVSATWQYPQSDWMYLSAGWHTYSVGLQNDYSNSSCDRNLWFDYMVIHRY